MCEKPNPSPTRWRSGAISRTIPAGFLPLGAHAGRYLLNLLSAQVGRDVAPRPPTSALGGASHSANEEADLSAATQQPSSPRDYWKISGRA